MALTDNCSVFASLHENGINRFVVHLMQQRPSLFNYATENVIRNPSLLCHAIDAHKVVTQRGNPLITKEPPLPIVGSSYALDWCLQVTDLKIDFHPGNIINLPPELAPPLKAQRFAIAGEICAAVGCPGDVDVGQLVPPPHVDPAGKHEEEAKTVVLPSRKLDCFCLKIFGVGHFVRATYFGQEYLELRLDGLEIVDVAPVGLENSLECYVKLLIQLTLLPKLRLALKTVSFEIMKPVSATLSFTPISAAVPNNPAVEKDQVKVFIDVGVGP